MLIGPGRAWRNDRGSPDLSDDVRRSSFRSSSELSSKLSTFFFVVLETVYLGFLSPEGAGSAVFTTSIDLLDAQPIDGLRILGKKPEILTQHRKNKTPNVNPVTPNTHKTCNRADGPSGNGPLFLSH